MSTTPWIATAFFALGVLATTESRASSVSISSQVAAGPSLALSVNRTKVGARQRLSAEALASAEGQSATEQMDRLHELRNVREEIELRQAVAPRVRKSERRISVEIGESLGSAGVRKAAPPKQMGRSGSALKERDLRARDL
jgi:hypothetical protein